MRDNTAVGPRLSFAGTGEARRQVAQALQALALLLRHDARFLGVGARGSREVAGPVVEGLTIVGGPQQQLARQVVDLLGVRRGVEEALFASAGVDDEGVSLVTEPVPGPVPDGAREDHGLARRAHDHRQQAPALESPVRTALAED